MVCWLMSSHQFWQFKPFQQSFKDLNEIKSYDCQSQDPLILVLSDTLKFIDFIGVDRFYSIVISYLVISRISWRPRKKKFKLVCLFHWWVACMEWRSKGSSIQIICLFGSEDFKFQRWTRGQGCFKWRDLI